MVLADICNQEVFDHGVSLGFFDMPKAEANELVERLTKETGRAHDWHYIGGRVHIKALPEGYEPKKESAWA